MVNLHMSICILKFSYVTVKKERNYMTQTVQNLSR